MSADRDVTRIVRSWLEEGVTELPDRVLDAVLDQVPATRQRRPWGPAWRSPQMNTPIRIAVALAAVVVLAVIGGGFVPRNAGVVGPPSIPSPSSALTPSPSATPLPSGPLSGPVAPGTYRTDFVTYTVAYTLPAGWTSLGAPTTQSQDAGGYAVVKPDSMPPRGMAFAEWQIAMVYRDPCHWIGTAAPVGPTVDALVAALVAQKGRSTPTPVDVTIDGFFGKEVDLMVPLAVRIPSCDGGEYLTWIDANGGYQGNDGPGQHDLLDIIDVNGRTLVIQRSFYPANTAADRAELQAIVDSIRITPQPTTPTGASSPSPTMASTIP